MSFMSEKVNNKQFIAGIITASDKGSTGEREDLSGPAIREYIEKEGYKVISMKVVPDDEDAIYNEINEKKEMAA